MRFGLYLVQHHLGWPELRDRARAADELGFDSVWLLDHLAPVYGDPGGACMEAWTALAALAACTEHVELGTLVSAVTFRHPSVLATQIATLDHISSGRATIGLGAGWNEVEHKALGIDFPGTAERIRRLDEALTLIVRLLSESDVTFDGDYFRLSHATYRPAPSRRPPIWIGATGPKMLRVVATHADAWHSFGHVEDLADKSAELDRIAREVGRNPTDITRVASLSLNREPEQVADKIGRWRNAGFEYLLAGWPKGGRAQLERISELTLGSYR